MKITTIEYRTGHISNKPCKTDLYYTRFANELLDLLDGMCGRKFDNNELKYIARKLTWYFEDIVADSGIWRSFSNRCRKMLGYNVPMYHDDEEYYDDEPSLDAVRYIIWDVYAEVNDCFPYAMSCDLKAVADAAYSFLDLHFEDAPINEELVKYNDDYISKAIQGFLPMREVLIMLTQSHYLVAGSWFYEYMNDGRQSMKKWADRMSPGMIDHYLTTKFMFFSNCGPLAIKPYEWLEALLRARGMDNVADDIAQIDAMKECRFLTKQRNDKGVTLESEFGKTIDVSYEELNIAKEEFDKYDGCAGSFIWYQGEWHLNGVLMPIDYQEVFEKVMAENIPAEGTKFADADYYLQRTDGKQLLFFKDGKAMLDFMHNTLKLPGSSQEGTILAMDHPCFFIDAKAKKDCVYIVPETELSIASHDNPYYDKKYAEKNAADLLHDKNACSTELLCHLIDNDLLPDVAYSGIFCSNLPASTLRSDMHFIARTMRRHKY